MVQKQIEKIFELYALYKLKYSKLTIAPAFDNVGHVKHFSSFG